MASGIKVTDEVVAAFDEVKQKHTYKYVTFRVSNCETKIIVENKVKVRLLGAHTYTSSTLHEKLSAPQICTEYASKLGIRVFNFFVFFTRCPDTIKIKAKMLHSSSSDALKKKCPATPIQANDRDELNFDEVRDKILKTSQ
ncbi:cofilin-like [Branchiostoma floridae]|uniref:Cofilin-like n=1 Tax=Branchiostoma floridae TaxID=7739 RepID=A0A9J7M926_BRAFL|nr:cofilin-like [Branchiostoma floridae]